MRSIFKLSSFMSVALAASDVLTIRSTSISTYSSCSSSASNIPVLPQSSSVFYGNVSSGSIQADAEPTSFASSSSRVQITSYEYETEYETDQITYTTCDSDGYCYVTTDLQKLTTYTTTVDGILTVVTTAIPVETDDLSAPSSYSSAVNPSYIQQTAQDIIGTSTESTSEEPTSTESTSIESTSTIASQTSSVVQSSAVITTSVVQSHSSSVAAGSESDITSSEIKTTLVTITACSHGSCSVVEKTTGYQVYTSDTTVYTTYCPLTNEASSSIAPIPETTKLSVKPESTHTQYSTEIITKTSCSNNKCSEVSKETTGVKIISNIDTVYTTYCPLSEIPTITIESKPQETTKTIASATESKSPVTVNVITDNIVVQTPTIIQQSSQETTIAAQSSSDAINTYSVTTYEGVGVSESMKSTKFFITLLSLIFLI